MFLSLLCICFHIYSDEQSIDCIILFLTSSWFFVLFSLHLSSFLSFSLTISLFLFLSFLFPFPPSIPLPLPLLSLSLLLFHLSLSHLIASIYDFFCFPFSFSRMLTMFFISVLGFLIDTFVLQFSGTVFDCLTNFCIYSCNESFTCRWHTNLLHACKKR